MKLCIPTELSKVTTDSLKRFGNGKFLMLVMFIGFITCLCFYHVYVTQLFGSILPIGSSVVNTADILVVAKFSVAVPTQEELKRMTLKELSGLYVRHVTTLQGFCSQPKRFGNVGYGGVRLCEDLHLGLYNGCTIYSYHHELSSRFENQIKLKYNCSIHFNRGISSSMNITILDHVNDFANRKQHDILILKVVHQDFHYLLHFFRSIKRLNFKQIVMDIHYSTQHETKDGYVYLLTALKELEYKCRVYWFERNWSFLSGTKANCITINMFCSGTSVTFSPYKHVESKPEIPNMDPFGSKDLQTKADYPLFEKMFVKYISKHQTFCEQVRRMGNIRDGGWDICNDIKYRPKSPCLVYSFGINNDFSFDEAMEKVYECDVYSFDPSMGIGDHRHSKRIQFFRTGISAYDSESENRTTESNKTWKLKRLQTIMRELNHENRRIDVLKLDIEGNEKDTLIDMMKSGVLKNVVQLCLEFHSYYDIGASRMLYDFGFRIFWTHQNPVAPFYTEVETFSHGNEVSFVNINIP